MFCRGFSVSRKLQRALCYNISICSYHSNARINNTKSSILETMKSLRGSVLEVVMRRLPAKDAKSLAEWWGISNTSESLPSSNIINLQSQQNSGVDSNSIEKLPSDKDEEIESERREQERINSLISNSTEMSDLALLHPVFGEFVHDLGYKKIYLTNIAALARAPIWERQRILRPERAQKLAKYKIGKSVIGGFPGVITMYHNASSGKCGIVDGQHRAAALIIMAQDGHWSPMTRNIAVDVFTVRNDEDVLGLFHEINSAEPVRLVDMPSLEEIRENAIESEKSASSSSYSVAPEPVTASTSRETLRHALDEAVDELSAKFPEMFKPSQRCRAPHLNVDVLRDDLFQTEFLLRHHLKSSSELLRKLLEVNSSLASLSDEDWKPLIGREGSKGKAVEAALKKARENGLYLGLSRHWLDSS